MQKKIVPHLWFDKEAKEAAGFYTGLFPDSRIAETMVLEGTPSGDAEVVHFQLAGQPFQAISAGPYFKFNSSISLMVACRTTQEVDKLHMALTKGGSELMELGEYPFSPRYSWVQDRYGLNWQLVQVDADAEEKIWPSLMFSGEMCGKAEEAARFYTTIFPESALGTAGRYESVQLMSDKPKVSYMEFKLAGKMLSAMDNAMVEGDAFNEAFSLVVNCKDQQEIDAYWDKLSAVPEAEQCGWIKDKYGVSWQIVPEQMEKILFEGTKEEIARVTEAFLKMKKFDIAELEKARRGE